MNWYLLALRKYADFSGRSRRREFWMFVLVNVIIGAIVSLIDRAIGTYVLSTIYGLALIIPAFAVGARRLHDINRTGWWQLLPVIPIVGIIILIVWWAKDSNPGPNQYGPNPKFAEGALSYP